MKSRIVLFALVAASGMHGGGVARADDVYAPVGDATVTAARCYPLPPPAEDAKDSPRYDPAEGPENMFRVRMSGNMLSIGFRSGDDDAVSIACRQFKLHFGGDNDEPFWVECWGDVRVDWPDSWCGFPALRMRADRLRFDSADGTAQLKSDGKGPCRLEYVLPGTGGDSTIVADEIRLHLDSGRVEARGALSVVLPRDDDD